MSEPEPPKEVQNSPSAPPSAPKKNKGRIENLTGRGRPKGIPNKMTTTVRLAIEQAFHGAGGVDYLVALAKKDPRAFVTLLVRIIPQEVRVDGQINHSIFTPDQLRRMADAQEEGESQIIDVTPIPTESDHE